MIGRSNVGKSSLINALAQRKKLAKTSKTPGATQLLNVYELGDEDSGRWIVDLPGYGYAKISKAQQKKMATMINDYLIERDTLDRAVLLFDANVGPTDLDLQTVDWLRHIELDFVLVGTKVDKIKPSQRGSRQKKSAEKSCLGCRERLVGTTPVKLPVLFASRRSAPARHAVDRQTS